MSRAPPEAPIKRRKSSMTFVSPNRSKSSSLSTFNSPSFESPNRSKSSSLSTFNSPSFESPNRSKSSSLSTFNSHSLESPNRSKSSSLNELSSLTLQQYVENIHQTYENIKQYSDKDLCDLVGGIEDNKFFVLMREQGANSKVYILNDQLAIKVVKTDDESKNEVERYIQFDPKNTGILNFPVIYRSVECNACNPTKVGLESHDSGESCECTLIVSELYDGSLFSIKKQFVKDKNSVISMLIQVIFACSILESSRLVHGDLHTGNILYKNLYKDQDLTYEIDGKDYTIKTYGKLWVLWDFGNMVEIGQTIFSTGIKAINTVKTDILRLVSLLGLRNKGFGELVDLIDRDSTTCKDLLLYLIRMLAL